LIKRNTPKQNQGWWEMVEKQHKHKNTKKEQAIMETLKKDVENALNQPQVESFWTKRGTKGCQGHHI
jgi:hypothetical protein